MEDINVSTVTDAKQFIVIKIGNEQFGIDIQYVDNIVRMQRITRVPKAQSYFKGVINLRGEIIPVMCIRLKFGLEQVPVSNTTRIIIIKMEQQSPIGIIVDEVKEVVTLDDDCVDKVTSYGNDEKGAFLSGIGKHKDTLISILNIAAVINDKESSQ